MKRKGREVAPGAPADRMPRDGLKYRETQERTGPLLAHGGLPGLRDENALESALARPRNRWTYGRTLLASHNPALAALREEALEVRSSYRLETGPLP